MFNAIQNWWTRLISQFIAHHKQDEIDSKIQNFSKEIEKLANSNKEGDRSFLLSLYSEYNSRFLSDNNRIWDTGKILLPFSLAGIAAIANATDPSFLTKFIIALASIAIIICWLISAENHRAFQNKSMTAMIIIENALGIKKTLPNKIPDKNSKINIALSGNAAVKHSIRALCLVIVICWLLVLLPISMGKKVPNNIINSDGKCVCANPKEKS